MKRIEKDIIKKMDKMCLHSLSPDVYEKWENVRRELFKNRKKRYSNCDESHI